MKKIYFSILITLSGLSAIAQPCTPNGTPTSTGLLPLPANFPCITQGQAFTQTIFFKNANIFNVSGNNVQVDTLEIISILNLPVGINALLNKTPAKYLAAENGCIQVSGNTNDTAGQYKLRIYIKMSLHLGTSKFVFTGEADSLSSALGQGPFFRYYVRVIKNCGLACPDLNDSTTQLFIRYGPPTPGIVASGDTTLCTGQSVVLTADSGAAGYRWSNGDTMRQTTIASSGNYRVTAYLNCDSAVSKVQQVRVTTTPVASIITGPNFSLANIILVAHPGGAQYQWYQDSARGHGYLPVGGATSDTFHGSCNYQVFLKVVVSAFGCADTASYSTICEGITDPLPAASVKLYPNPASSKINISVLNGVKINRIIILDLVGKILETFYREGAFLTSEQIDIQKLPVGMYVLVAEGPNAKTMLKFIKTE